jgi:hypothetical protein
LWNAVKEDANRSKELEGVEENRPSGAKARVDFAELYGTAKALPFQSNVKSGRQAKTRLATGGVE